MCVILTSANDEHFGAIFGPNVVLWSDLFFVSGRKAGGGERWRKTWKKANKSEVRPRCTNFGIPVRRKGSFYGEEQIVFRASLHSMWKILFGIICEQKTRQRYIFQEVREPQLGIKPTTLDAKYYPWHIRLTTQNKKLVDFFYSVLSTECATDCISRGFGGGAFQIGSWWCGCSHIARIQYMPREWCEYHSHKRTNLKQPR